MNIIWRKLLLSLVISTVLLSLCSAADLLDSKEDDDGDNSHEDDCGWCPDDDGWKPSNGAIAGIVIAILVVLFGIPILLCFCCAWCCFRHRRKVPGTVIASAPPAHQYPQQQYYPNGGGQPQVVISHPQHLNNEFNQIPSTNYDSQTLKNNHSPHATVQATQGDNNNSSPNDTSHIYEEPPSYYEVAGISTVPQSNKTSERNSKS